MLLATMKKLYQNVECNEEATLLCLKLTCLPICYTETVRISKSTSANYDYFVKADTSRYSGEWIALADRKVIAHGKDAHEVYRQAQKSAKGKHISLAKTPDQQMLVLPVEFAVAFL